MAKLSRLAGSTSHVLEIFCQDSSSATGGGLTGLVYNAAGLTCYYKRNAATAAVAVTLADIATLGTYATGGLKAVDGTNMPGVYEFHPPDAAYASGAKSVVFMLKGATSLAPVLIEVELTAVDNQSTAFGLSLAKTTNLTGFNDIAATAVVSAGAITTAAGKVSGVALVDTLTAYTGNTPQTGDNFARLGAPAGASLSADVAAVNARTTNLPAAPADESLVIAATTAIYNRIGAPAGASIAADVQTRSTYAGGAVASVTAGVTVTTNNDKTGYALAVTPPTAAQIAAAVMSDVSDTVGADVVAVKAKTDNLPAAPASTTNITAGTVTTVTNLTNAPTAGDFTAAMKASLNAATPAATVSDKTGFALAAAGLDAVAVEAGVNARQALAVAAAVAAGVLAGAAGTTVTIAAAGNPSTNRVTATVDASGNRSSVTLDLPA